MGLRPGELSVGGVGHVAHRRHVGGHQGVGHVAGHLGQQPGPLLDVGRGRPGRGRWESDGQDESEGDRVPQAAGDGERLGGQSVPPILVRSPSVTMALD